MYVAAILILGLQLLLPAEISAQAPVQDSALTEQSPELSEEAGRIVHDVRIEGNETIPEAVILQKIQSQPQRPVTERQLREDKRSLLNTRWFFDVQERIDETPNGYVLVFEVKERPIVQRVQYIGNKKVKLKHLEAWTGLKAGSPFDYVANQEAVRRIEQEYKDKGYYFVEVKLLKGGKPGDREVIFKITEGPKVQVKERNFTGNVFWSDGLLRKNLVSKEAFLFWGGHYNPDTMPADIEALKAYYRGVGFFDVEVTGEPRFSPDKSDVELLYTVKEGMRYTVRSITYEGNEVVQESRLKEDSKQVVGQKFNSWQLSKDVQRMLGYYGDMGHYFASVNPVPHFTETPGVVDLVFEIDEDRPRYIRDINVNYEGDSPHTKHTVVLDRIQVQPGDLADPRRIRRGKSRLAGSGLFEQGIVFEPVPVDPEQTSFASVAASFRGQNPGQLDDWTESFLQAVDQSASDTARRGEIGDYSELYPASNSDRTADSAASPGSERPNTVDAAAEVEAAVEPATSHAPVIAPAQKSLDQILQNSDNFTTATLAGRTLQNQTATDVNAPADLLRLPRQSTFRPADPRLLFNSADDSPAVVSAGDPELLNGPIIRAQSPADEGSGIEPPAREDQMINESPYRNQFREIPPGWVDINVNATEGRTGRLMFGAGVNSNSGLVGNFVWDESNFDLFRPPTTFADILEGRAWRGGGQRFRAEAAPGNLVSRYALTWTDPYFMYTDYSLSVGGFYFNRFYSEWTEDRVGGRVSVGRQFTPEWSGAVALRLEDIEMRNVRAPVPTIVEPWVGHNFLSTGRVSVTHDTRDSAMLPTEGHYFDVGYEQAFNEFNFPKVDSEFRQYFTLHSRPDGSGRQVLTLAGALGWAGDDTPVFERYFAGGFQSFRGFRFRGVTPRDDTGFSLGGTFQALGTVEYRLPLTADDMISAVAFSDFGSVDDEVTLSEFRATAGFGLRLTIPQMGPVPLAFDFAFPITTQPADREQIFSFYVGINR
jgi:outer membrane protein insertion porin family